MYYDTIHLSQVFFLIVTDKRTENVLYIYRFRTKPTYFDKAHVARDKEVIFCRAIQNIVH